MEDTEERRAVNHQEVVGARAAPAKSDESPDDFGCMNIANFEAVPCGETPDDGGSDGLRGFMIVAVETEGPNFRSVGAAVGRMSPPVTNKDDVTFEVRRLGTVEKTGTEIV